MAFVLRFLSYVIALFAIACSAGDEGLILPPFDELEWPEIDEPPSCVPWRGTYEMPLLAPPAGLLRIEPSAALIPTGVIERMEVLVLNEDRGSLDASASGALTVEPASGIEVISQTEVEAGEAEVALRFSAPGVYEVFLSLQGDPRSGTIEVQAYEPRLPIWEVRAATDELEEMFASPSERIKIDAQLAAGKSTYDTTVRIHGGASRDFSKKSLRFDLQNGDRLPSGEQHLIARAEFNDKSMLRTWLGYEFFRNGTLLPTPSSEFIHLRINERYFGLMNHVERIDGRFLTERGLDPDGNLYEADPPLELAVPGGNLTPLATIEDYYRTYQWHAGPGAWEDLIEFIEVTLQLPDKAFAEVIGDHVQIDSYLTYLAAMAVLQNQEHIRKNFYIYRDPDGEEKRWTAFPWDLDLTFGHLWSEVDDVLDERIISDGDLFVGEYAPERYGYYNQLADRMLKHPDLRRRFLRLVERLTDSTFTLAFTDGRLDYALCLLEPDLLADSEKWAENSEYLDRVDEIRDFVSARRIYIEDVLESHGIAPAP